MRLRAAALALWFAGCSTPTLTLHPEQPRTDDDLHARTDGDAELWWYRDGAFVTTGASVPAAWTRKGERWKVEARSGEKVLATASRIVQNTPPDVELTLAGTAIEGADVLPDLTLFDADGDELTWSATWARDGVVEPSLTTLGLPGALTRAGQVWTLSITVDDADAEPITVSRELRLLELPATPDPGAWLFHEQSIHTFRLTLSEAATALLQASPTTWAHGDLEVDGVALTNIGVRLKGNGSFNPIEGKPSFRLDLDRWVPDQELDGLDELVLNNMWLDPSQVHERLSYEVYRTLGVPAPRAVHANVLVGDLDKGMYTLVEGVDGRFLDRWFADDTGPLYELFDVDFVPDQLALFDHDGGPDDRQALFEVATALQQPDFRFSEDLAHLVDVPAFVNYLAVSAAIGQFDAYPWSFPGDDLYVYVDPSDGLIRFIAHGADETFTAPRRPVDYLYGALGTACLDDPACREAWLLRMWEVCDHFETGAVLTQLEQVSALIMTRVQADPVRPYTSAEVSEAHEALIDFVNTRRVRLEAMPGLR